jgi:hypothetical protein
VSGRARLLVAAAAIAALCAGAGAWALTRGGDDRPAVTASAAPGKGSSQTTDARRGSTGRADDGTGGTAAGRGRSGSRGGSSGPGSGAGSGSPGTTAKQGSGGTTPTTAARRPGGPGRTSSIPPITLPPPGGGTPVDPVLQKAYADAYEYECRQIWSIADADGLLWDPDDDADPRTPHRVEECLAGLDPQGGQLAWTTDEAEEYGVEDADYIASSLTWFGILKNTAGTRTWHAPDS